MRTHNNDRIRRVTEAMLCMQRASWEQGVCAQALIAQGDEGRALLFAHEAVVRQAADGRLGVVGEDASVCDPAANGIPVLFAWQRTKAEMYRSAARRMAEWLLNTSRKASDGTLYHLIHRDEVWIDSLYMAPPFLAAAGYFEEAVAQVGGFRRFLWDRDRALFSHKWDDAAKRLGRPEFWASGNGWAAAGIVRILEYLPDTAEGRRAELSGYLTELLDGASSRLRPDGLFHDVLDDPSSFVETNAGQMFAFAIYRGVVLGFVGENYLGRAEAMRAAAISKIDEEGFVRGACGSPDFDTPGVSAEAQAFFLLMEAARAGLSV